MKKSVCVCGCGKGLLLSLPALLCYENIKYHNTFSSFVCLWEAALLLFYAYEVWSVAKYSNPRKTVTVNDLHLSTQPCLKVFKKIILSHIFLKVKSFPESCIFLLNIQPCSWVKAAGLSRSRNIKFEIRGTLICQFLSSRKRESEYWTKTLIYFLKYKILLYVKLL